MPGSIEKHHVPPSEHARTASQRPSGRRSRQDGATGPMAPVSRRPVEMLRSRRHGCRAGTATTREAGWVLFSDAARVRVQDLRADLGQYSRLLGIGLPLTILAGWGLARWLFPELDGWLALLVAAALAPTDAALGVPVVTNPAVPSRIRRLITVESGLNDGVATPVVMFAIAGAAAVEGVEGAAGLGTALAQLAIGAVIGVVIGGAGGALLRLTRRKGWVAEDFAGIAVLALALAAYMVAIVVGGNGFVAAFCGGLAFGATAGRRGPRAPRGSRPRSAPSSPSRVRPARRSPIEPSRCPGIRPPARPLPAHPWRPPRRPRRADTSCAGRRVRRYAHGPPAIGTLAPYPAAGRSSR